MKENLNTIFRVVVKAWVSVAIAVGSLLMLTVIFVLVASTRQSQSAEDLTLHEKVLKKGGDTVIALITLEGPIVESSSDSDPLAISPSIIASLKLGLMLEKLAQNEQVKGVVLRINSPGGAVVASDELYQNILKLRQEKPVVASFGDVAASGGYYIAAGANKIVANPATITGSIGVIAQFPELTGLFSKIGVEMRTFKSGPYKDITAADRAMTPAEEEIINQIVTDSYDQFIAAIVQGRGMDEKKVRELADGRIYSGKQALSLGLVDELGTTDKAIEVASNLAQVEEPTIVEYSDEGFWQSLFQSKLQLNTTVPFLQNQAVQPKWGIYYLVQL